MSKLEIEVQRLTTELEKTKELLAIRTAIISTGFLSVTWTHNIVGHAANIRDMALVLRRNCQTKSSDSIIRCLSDIEKVAEKILKILRNPKVPPLTAKEGLEIICMNDLLRKCNQFIDSRRNDDVSLSLVLGPDDQILVRANGWWMDQVLEIIIKNASKAMFNSTEKTLTISSSVVEGSLVEIVLRDTGCGIPEGILPKIFKEPIIKPHSQKGLGIGLLMAMTIVQVYEGSIKLLNTDKDGSALAIILPQASSH